MFCHYNCLLPPIHAAVLFALLTFLLRRAVVFVLKYSNWWKTRKVLNFSFNFFHISSASLQLKGCKGYKSELSHCSCILGLLEYQAMPSFRNKAHDRWLYTVTIWQQLDIPSASSWAAPVRATVAVRKRQLVRSAHGVQNHTCRVTLLQPARRAAVLGQPSSFRPRWSPPKHFHSPCYSRSPILIILVSSREDKHSH